MAHLIDRLIEEGPRFDFYQAVQLLEEYLREAGAGDDPLNAGVIRFGTDPSITFPASDISRIRAGDGRIQMDLTFMGLFGISSPLPAYFSEYILKHEEHSGALRDFLTIFNHRIYTLFYRAWKKYRLLRCFGATEADAFTRRITLLSGQANGHSATPVELRRLACAGLFSGRVRSASALGTLLSGFFDVPVGIQQWVGSWVKLPDPPAMGATAQLGINTIIGTHVYDVSGKFRVCVGPLTRDEYESFLPGSGRIADLKGLVQGFLADPLDWDVELRMQSTDLVPVILGAANAPLGHTSSLGSSGGRSEEHVVVFAA